MVVSLRRPGPTLYPAATVVPTGHPRTLPDLVSVLPQLGHLFVRIGCSKLDLLHVLCKVDIYKGKNAKFISV